ncbi:major facilitator superfamily domain-containing protein [Aspergillus pseudodeflectus]|uniref:Major facilitator superfamily domain-containing protein n=1 Tax=Aspergillus pseudodeflectus TaxID=176178 RepID=A0ABR4KNU8_9EURO
MIVEEQFFRPDWRLRCIFCVIGLLNFAAALDATSLSVAIPAIAEDLGGTSVEAFWSGTSFLVCSCVFQPVFTLSSAIFGSSRMLFAAVLAFSLGAILAAVAQGFTLLLIGRCSQGVGGGGIIALTEVLIANLIPLQERGKWMGFRALTWAFGTVIGPVIGGALAEHAWRWIFWINLPFCGLGLVLIPLVMRLHRDNSPLWNRLVTVDYIGSVIFVGSLSSLLVPLSWGGIMYPWTSWHTLVPLILGAAGLALFAVYEATVPSNPLIPLKIFRTPTTVINYLGCFLHGMIMWCVLYYLPLYYEASLGYSAVSAGVAILPLTLTVAPLSAVTGVLIAKTHRYRSVIWFGWTTATLGAGIMYLLDEDTTIVQWIFLTLVSGIGLGSLFTSMMLAVQASADPAFLSITASMAAFFRTLGQTIGVAIGGVVFQNRVRVELSEHPSLSAQASDLARDAASLVQYIQSLPHGVGATGTDERAILEESYASALGIVWATLCGLAGLGLITSLLTKEYPMVQAFSPQQGIRSEANQDRDVAEEKTG